MSDVEIKGRITVDNGNALKSTNELVDAVKEAKKALADAKLGSQEYKTAQENLSKVSKDLDNAVSKNGGSFSKLKETLSSTVPGFKGASDGAAGLGRQLWLLVANPIGATIAAIVGGMTLLYKAFASTNDGADRMEQIMSGLGAVLDVLTERVLKMGGAIYKFFTGDFKGAMTDASAAVTGFVDQATDAFNKAGESTKKLQELQDQNREIILSRAKLEYELAVAKEKMNDADLSSTERLAAVKKVRAAEAMQSQKEIAAAEANLQAIRDQNRLAAGSASDEELDKEAEAAAKVYQIRQTSAQQNRQLNKLENQITKDEKAKADEENRKAEERKKTERANLRAYEIKQQDLDAELRLSKMKEGQEKELEVLSIGFAKQKAANKQAVEDGQLTQMQADELNLKMEQITVDKRIAIQDKYAQATKDKEAEQVKTSETLSLRIINFRIQQSVNEIAQQRKLLDEKQAIIDAQYQREINSATLTAQQKAEIEQKYTEDNASMSDARKKIDDAEYNAKVTRVAEFGALLNQASEILGKNTVAGKALAVAGASIDTYAAIAKNLKAFAGVPIPGYAIAQAIATGVAGLAAVKKIISVQVPNSPGGASSVSMPSINAPAPLTPQRTSTRLDADTIQEVGNAAKGGVMRAFVLESDIRDNAERIARINRAARLG